MEYIAVLNNYLEYSLDVLSFQSTSMHVFHAAVVQKMLCYILNLTD